MIPVYIREQTVKIMTDDGLKIIPTCKKSVNTATETDNGITEN